LFKYIKQNLWYLNLGAMKSKNKKKHRHTLAFPVEIFLRSTDHSTPLEKRGISVAGPGSFFFPF